jgi:hypothetical protein
MAFTGFRYPRACRITEAAGVETLGTGFTLSKGIKADININNSKKILYADDGPADSVNKFIGGTGTLEGNGISMTARAALAGATITGEEIEYSGDDVAPFFRYGHIGRQVDGNTTSYLATIYLKVQFDIPAESLETEGNDVPLKTVSIPFTIFKNVDGSWCKQKAFTTLAEAVTYLNTQTNQTFATPSAAEFDGTNDVTIVVTGSAVSSVKNGTSTLVSGTDYVNTAGSVAIKAAYLTSLGAGTHVLTFVTADAVNPTAAITPA